MTNETLVERPLRYGPEFSDQSVATPLEKAMRVLAGIEDFSSSYFHPDGFPKSTLAPNISAANSVIKQTLERLQGELVRVQELHTGLMRNADAMNDDLRKELAACREAAIEECAKIAEKHGADDGGPSDTGSARVANVVREIRALKGQK